MGTGANQIATKKDLYTAFGAFASASTSRECPTYAEIIAEGLIVSTTLDSKRLVKYSLISAAVVQSGISLSSTSWYVGSNSASVNVTVTLTNATGFTVTDNATWITTSKSGNTVTITATANTSTSSRSGTVTFTVSASQAGDGVARTATFTVSQSGAAAYDPTITVYITNLQAITEYHNPVGIDGDTYFTWSDGSDIDVDLTYDLYYYDGNLYNTIRGTLSQWEAWYDLVSGSDDCCLWNSDWGDVIAGPMGDSDCDRLMETIREAIDSGDTECNFEFPFDLAPSPSVSPTSITFPSSGGSRTVTLNNGVLTSSSKTSSWITLSGAATGSTSVTITASANTTTSPRSGYVYIYVNGTSCSIYVYQNGQTSTDVTIPVSYSIDWGSANGVELDISLSVSGYNTSTGNTKPIASNVRINAGYSGPQHDGTTFLGNLIIPEGEIGDWEIRVWGNYYSSSNGWANICFWDSETANHRYAACSDLDMAGWYSASTAPALSAPLTHIENYGGSVDILFWSDEYGSGWDSDISDVIQGSGGGNTDAPIVTVTPNQYNGWGLSSKSSISGYRCYQSSNSYHTNNGLDIMRINISGMGGYKFTIYIRSYAETTYDYTAAGALDVALSTTNNSTNYPTGSYSSMPSSIKAWTRGNQQSGTDLSSYTAVTYNIPDNFPHFIDIAYKKDSGVNTGDDRGYVLIPNTYLA